MIRIPYCDGYLFRIGKARFVYSHELDNFVLAAYNEEIIDRQHPGLDSRIINYDLPEKPMMLSAFSPMCGRGIRQKRCIIKMTPYPKNSLSEK